MTMCVGRGFVYMKNNGESDNSSNVDLVKYRISCAWEDLESAEKNLTIEEYKTANNRAYYAVFHAMSAALSLRNLGYKHHSQVIGAFNKNFVHGGVFPKEISGKISSIQRIRTKSDYEDFFIISIEDTKEQVRIAREIVGMIAEYVKEQL